VSYDAGVPDEVRTMLYDPQTAGGLLLSIAAADSTELVSALRSAGVPAVEIGEVLPARKPLIEVFYLPTKQN
jgi:selenide, water dikinase